LGVPPPRAPGTQATFLEAQHLQAAAFKEATMIRKGAVNWKNNPVDLEGPELKPGDRAPSEFTVVASDMSAVAGQDLAGRPRILCAVPSLDTPVCDRETRRFNEEAAKLSGVAVYTLSVDLPFAQKRWCGNAGIERVKTLSDYKDRSFARAYGVWVPAMALMARAVFVIDGHDALRHVEYVKEVGSEPNYAAALEAASAL
jgi:thiol peroxidase